MCLGSPVTSSKRGTRRQNVSGCSLCVCVQARVHALAHRFAISSLRPALDLDDTPTLLLCQPPHSRVCVCIASRGGCWLWQWLAWIARRRVTEINAVTIGRDGDPPVPNTSNTQVSLSVGIACETQLPTRATTTTATASTLTRWPLGHPQSMWCGTPEATPHDGRQAPSTRVPACVQCHTKLLAHRQQRTTRSSDSPPATRRYLWRSCLHRSHGHAQNRLEVFELQQPNTQREGCEHTIPRPTVTTKVALPIPLAWAPV